MEQLQEYLDIAATRRRFTREEKAGVPALLDEMYRVLQTRQSPPGFRLGSGEVAKGATGRIALNAYFLLIGRIAYGKDYARKDPRMHAWCRELAFNVMNSYFGGWTEKGMYCCGTCSLSMLPLYCVGAFEFFDCEELKNNVIRALKEKRGAFARPSLSRKYAEWVMRFA